MKHITHYMLKAFEGWEGVVERRKKEAMARNTGQESATGGNFGRTKQNIRKAEKAGG